MLQEGGGVTMPDGKAMPHLSIITPPAHYDTEMAATGKVIQNRLKYFGFPISWEALAFRSLVNKVRNESDFDMFILGWRGLSLDPDYLRRFFYSSRDHLNHWNYPGYDNVEFDKLANLQVRTLDLQERRKIVLNLQSKLMTDVLYIPLYVPIGWREFEQIDLRVG